MAQNAVEKAIAAVHGPTKASFICQVSVGAIWKWRKSGVISDGRAAYLLWKASGVPLEELIGIAGNGHTNGGGDQITGTYQGLDPFQEEAATGGHVHISQVA